MTTLQSFLQSHSLKKVFEFPTISKQKSSKGPSVLHFCHKFKSVHEILTVSKVISWQPSWISDLQMIQKFSIGQPYNHSCKVTIQSTYQFLTRFLKTMTNQNSEHKICCCLPMLHVFSDLC